MDFETSAPATEPAKEDEPPVAENELAPIVPLDPSDGGGDGGNPAPPPSAPPPPPAFGPELHADWGAQYGESHLSGDEHEANTEHTLPHQQREVRAEHERNHPGHQRRAAAPRHAEHHARHPHEQMNDQARAGGQPAAAGHLYSLHLQLLNSATDLPHATLEQAKVALQGHASNISTWVSAAQEMHRSLAQLHTDSPVVSAVSEGMASAGEEAHEFWTWTKRLVHRGGDEQQEPKYLDRKVELPETGIWDRPLDMLLAAREQLRAGHIEEAIARLNDAASAYRHAYRLLCEYKERTEGGAASAIGALHVAEVAGAISFSVITAGAGSGLAGSAVAAGLGGGGYAVAKGTAEQASEKAHGLRDQMDWKAVLKNGAEEAISSFVGALTAGALSKLFLRTLGERVLSCLGKDEIAALAEHARVSGEALHPEAFAQRGWAWVADLAGGIGSSPVVTAVSTVVHAGISGEWPKTREEFVDQVVGDMLRGAFFQVLLGAITHGSGLRHKGGDPAADLKLDPRSPLPEHGGSNEVVESSGDAHSSSESHGQHDGAQAPTPRPSSPASPLLEYAPYVREQLNQPIPPEVRVELEQRWSRIEATAARIESARASADPAALGSAREEINQLRREVSTTVRGDSGAQADPNAETATRNWEQANAKVDQWAQSQEPLTLDRVRELNRTLGEGLENNGGVAGDLRSHDVAAGGNLRKAYIAHDLVEGEMAEFLKWYQANESRMPPVELAAGAYQRLVSIHPFMDANGRTCRLVMDWVLQKHGLPPATFAAGEENVAAFWFDKVSGGGVSPAQAVQAVTNAIERSLEIMNRAVQTGNRQ